ncbi:MAG: tetratricopeptide repeat protein, partial [Myxococcota bacterium]
MSCLATVAVLTWLCPALPAGLGGDSSWLSVPAAEARRGAKKSAKKNAREARKQKKIQRHLFTAQYLLLHEKDLNAAAREYRKVLKLDRGNIDAGLALAGIEIKNKKPKKAIKLLDKLARQKPKDNRLWHALGAAHAARGDGEAALGAYRQALVNDPRDDQAHWLLFDHLNDRYRSGDRTLKEPLRQASEGYLRHAKRRQGLNYQQVERTHIELTKDPVALMIYDADAAYKAAFTHKRIGRINAQMAKARQGYEECLRSQPDNQRCHLGMGRVYASVKASKYYSRDKARSHFTRANRLPAAHIELARLLRFEDDLDGARAALRGALAIDKDHQRALLELGIVYKLEGEGDRAAETLVKAIKANRFSAESARAMEELTAIDPEHPLLVARSRWGVPPGDIFTTDRFKAAIGQLEEMFGGV